VAFLSSVRKIKKSGKIYNENTEKKDGKRKTEKTESEKL